MAFTINLASESVGLLKRLRLGLIAAALLLSLALGGGVMAVMAQREQLTREQARTADLTEQQRKIEERFRQQGLVINDAHLAALTAQVTVANDLLGQRRFVWSRLFFDLERAVPRGVSLFSVQPQPESALTLRGRALAESYLTGPGGLLRSLEQADAFHDVSIADQKIEEDGTVSFTLHVQYRRPQTHAAG